MSRIARIEAVCLIAAVALLAVPIATAKKVPDPPSAPIPIQVLTGKKVFISNSESTADIIFRVPNLTYNVLYEHMNGWGEYELVRAPADADLIFNINFFDLVGTAASLGGSRSQNTCCALDIRGGSTTVGSAGDRPQELRSGDV